MADKTYMKQKQDETQDKKQLQNLFNRGRKLLKMQFTFIKGSFTFIVRPTF